VGGIVVMRYGENADEVIRRVKTKMTEVAKGLPEGVKFRLVYDRAA
jgi:Cu/Ag efflux pump CusA